MKVSMDRQSPLDRLQRAAYSFEFFQAVRLLELAAAQLDTKASGERPGSRNVGFDTTPTAEVVRFHSVASLGHPSSELQSVQSRSGAPATADAPCWEMIVTFLGLTGPSGVLPTHYSQLVIDRMRHKDASLRDFLDLFNHRLISLFYRAWSKYRLPMTYERHQIGSDGRTDDPITAALMALVGLGTGGLRQRQLLADATWVHFGGYLSHYPRNAISLASMITSYFCVPARVQSFQGQWLVLAPHDQSRMVGQGRPLGVFHQQLGQDVVVGERVWSVENRFRVTLGPLNYATFRQYMPDGERLGELQEMVRFYAGPEFDFDVQPLLSRYEVPQAQLAEGPVATCRLGWNSWIQSRPRPRDADEAVFEGGVST